MARRKGSRVSARGLLRPLGLVLRHHRIVLLVLLLGGFVLGGRAIWLKFAPTILSGPDYLVTAECIVVNPPPEWIQSDVVGESVLNGSLDGLKITENRLTVKVADAFAMHPWVEEVVRVHKSFPARVEVELRYRKPVAMVEVMSNGHPALFPVDRLGVLLPPQDFMPPQDFVPPVDFDPAAATRYLRINVGLSWPAGPVGTPWGDNKVAGAAEIADLLGTQWQKLGLLRVIVETDSEEPALRLPSLYVITAENGSRILWGHAPGKEISREATADTKLARLVRYCENAGRLTDTPPQQIDLRDIRQVEVSPLTASLPAAAPQ